MSVISNLCVCVCVCVCVCARALHLTGLLISTVICILVTSVMNEYEALVIGEKMTSSFKRADCSNDLT